MGSGNCFSSNNDNQSKNLYENNIEASNIEENPQKNKEPEIPLKEQILVSENEAVSIQSALRGYTARKDLQKPLFNIKESRDFSFITFLIIFKFLINAILPHPFTK